VIPRCIGLIHRQTDIIWQIVSTIHFFHDSMAPRSRQSCGISLQAYNCLEDLRSRVPKVNPSVYIEPRIIEAVHRAVNVPLKEVAVTRNGATNGHKPNVGAGRGGSDDEDEGEILDEEVSMD
jgi:hypothetical protein